MKLFHSITAFLRRGAPDFSVLEMAVLCEAERQLDPARAGKLRRRIESINLVQRLDGGREVNAYSMKNGQPSVDESLRLVSEDGEKALATFSFCDAEERSYEGTIWLVGGQLFSLEFSNITEHALEDPPKDLKLSICAL